MRTLTRLAALGAGLAVAAGSLAVAVPASADVRPQGLARGATTVTLTDAALGALGPLSPTAVSPGVLGVHGDDVQVSFPVVGNPAKGVIKHTGGLSLTDGETVLSLTNYYISGASLTAIAAVDGTEIGRIPLFDLTGAPAQAGCEATANLALSGDAADALTALFGAGDLTGAPIGAACVDLR